MSSILLPRIFSHVVFLEHDFKKIRNNTAWIGHISFNRPSAWGVLKRLWHLQCASDSCSKCAYTFVRSPHAEFVLIAEFQLPCHNICVSTRNSSAERLSFVFFTINGKNTKLNIMLCSFQAGYQMPAESWLRFPWSSSLMEWHRASLPTQAASVDLLSVWVDGRSEASIFPFPQNGPTR